MVSLAAKDIIREIQEGYYFMKKVLLIFSVTATLISCTSVIGKDLMSSGTRDISFSEIVAHPEHFQGKLFILGGIIVETKITAEASIVEAIYVPVDRYGNLLDIDIASNRFRAVYPKGEGFLDPLIYRKGREITMAGELIMADSGKIDEMDYVFPVFEIKELYLWEEKKYYYMYPSYPGWYSPYYYPRYPYYWWDDPLWYRPYNFPPYYPYEYRPKR